MSFKKYVEHLITEGAWNFESGKDENSITYKLKDGTVKVTFSENRGKEYWECEVRSNNGPLMSTLEKNGFVLDDFNEETYATSVELKDIQKGLKAIKVPFTNKEIGQLQSL